MHLDKVTVAATLWMGALGAAELILRLPHPLGAAIALGAAAPLALRLAMLASRPALPDQIAAADAQALALAQSGGDARPAPADPSAPGDGQRREDWRAAML